MKPTLTVFGFLFFLVTTATSAATFTVNSLGDASDANPGDGICSTSGGVCTLRAAIQEANAFAGADAIHFGVAGTITLTGQLPSITEQITIDGTTAPGYSGAPVVIVSGGGAIPTGLPFSSGSNSTVSGLQLYGFTSNAVSVAISGFTITKCYLGPIGGGSANLDGIFVSGSADSTTIGGTTHGLGNVISGNSRYGINMSGSNHEVLDNYIGTNAAGTAALGNATAGIFIQGDTVNIGIGSTSSATYNVISGNGDGIIVHDAIASIAIGGNLIGTDKSGSVAIGNSGIGVHLINCSNDPIGSPGAPNVISGNGGDGLYLDGACASNTIANNTIGLNQAGTAALANANGIHDFGTNNIIGTTLSRNVISGNTTDGIVEESSASGAKILNNIIGLDATGTTITSNGRYGINLNGASNVTIGGGASNQTNVISGNGADGIVSLSAKTVSIYGNDIGVAIDGATIRGNGGAGVHVSGGDAVIIGASGGGNVISGNSTDGVLADTNATNLNVTYNAIGVDSGKTLATGNLADGIDLQSISNANIAFNTIAANGSHGVQLSVSGSGNQIAQNTIGKNGLPNAGDGVRIQDAVSNTTVGSVALGGNTISNNSGAGVTVLNTATGNAIEANSIVSNGGLGIDLGNDGVTANDAGDADNGPNTLQNFPQLSGAITNGSQTTIAGSINTTPNTALTLDFFSNAAADPTTYGEGQTYLGSTNVTTDGSGNASFTFTGPAVAIGAFLSATATSSGGTSEFAQDVTAGVAPTLQFSSPTYSVNENGGSATITVTRSGNTTFSSTVDYATSNGTATAGADYTATSGTLTFGPGQTSATFNVPILDDTIYEGNETVNLTLSNPSGASLGSPSTAVLTIVDNETPPAISIADVSQNEGNSGTTPFTFTVTLSGASAFTTTVDYATANGTATAPSDYTAASGTVTFAPGVTSQTITVNVVGDTVTEPNETFFVNLTNPTNATIAKAQGTGTIINDDGVPSVSINNVSQNEGNSGTTPFVFTVTLSNASASTITVDYATADGTANAGSDYNAASGTVTFAPGVTSQSVTVNVIGDTTFEPNETFFVNLTNPTNASLGNAQGTGTIVNDDAPTADVSIVKTASAGPGQVTYTIVVSNGGPDAATGVTMTDTLPAGVTLVSASSSSATCSGTSTITCTMATLNAGASFTATIVVSGAQAASAINTATVHANELDPNPANNTATTTANVPTLSEWALLLLGALLAGIAIVKTR